MSRTPDLPTIGPALASFAVTALAVGATWWWLGAPIELPPSPLAAGQKLYCVSYTPFRGEQSPLVEGTRADPWQIEEDLALLSKYTGCVRTYSVTDGLDNVLASARRHGLKVLEGIWISNNAAKTRRQIATGIALAKQYPDVITGVIVGNEVLLRGEISVPDLIAIIREVKAQVSVPVTYADVWEYWLRYPEVQNAVDFVTIHILPYWEDFPIPAWRAAAHVADIRRKVADAMPGKEIVIGEFGWPSAGRMRESARPSRANQARAVAETLALAQRENFRVNIIEAFDQPWKRALEGTVGGYWGIFDRATGAPKFSFSGSVSDHPHWPLQALAGILLTALTFGGALIFGRKKGLRHIVVAQDRRAVLSSRRLVRLDDRDGPDGKLQLRQLAALACLRRDGGCRSDRLCGRLRRRPCAAALRGAPWPQRRTPRRHRLGARRHARRTDAGVGRSRARAGVRSALPRHSVCAADGSRCAVLGLAGVDTASNGLARDSRDRCRRRTRLIGRLHRVQRAVFQLAVGLVLCGIDRLGFHP